MTTQDYVRFARAIHKARQFRPTRMVDASYAGGIAQVVNALIEELGADNPNFDKDMFLKACLFDAEQDQVDDDQPKVMVEVYGGEAHVYTKGVVETCVVDWDLINAETATLTPEQMAWMDMFGSNPEYQGALYLSK